MIWLVQTKHNLYIYRAVLHRSDLIEQIYKIIGLRCIAIIKRRSFDWCLCAAAAWQQEGSNYSDCPPPPIAIAIHQSLLSARGCFATGGGRDARRDDCSYWDWIKGVNRLGIRSISRTCTHHWSNKQQDAEGTCRNTPSKFLLNIIIGGISYLLRGFKQEKKMDDWNLVFNRSRFIVHRRNHDLRVEHGERERGAIWKKKYIFDDYRLRRISVANA